MYYCYILRCNDGTLYTGMTNDPKKRLTVHNKGKGAAYTAARLPVIMVYCEPVGERGEALKREAQIKKWTRAQKLKLINSNRSTA